MLEANSAKMDGQETSTKHFVVWSLVAWNNEKINLAESSSNNVPESGEERPIASRSKRPNLLEDSVSILEGFGSVHFGGGGAFNGILASTTSLRGMHSPFLCSSAKISSPRSISLT
jgi:hypothetical protein